MSDNIILNLGGGGGASLNFKVVGNPKPENPRENTIWLNTDVPIGAWYFSATQPENLVDGDVWFPVGTSSPAEFNVLKKNGIQVYPVSAYQLVGGALEYKEAQIRRNGEWIGLWDGWLYDSGNQYENITGGWQKTTNGGTATIGTSSMTVSASGAGNNARIQTGNMINLSGFDTLCVNVTAWSSGDNSSNRCQIRIVDADGNIISQTNVNAKKEYQIDVSALDAGYIRLFAFASEDYTHKMTVDKIWLERGSSIALADLDAAYQEGVNSAYD